MLTNYRSSRPALLLAPIYPSPLSQAEAVVGEKVAVHGQESLRIRLLVEPVDLHDVPVVLHLRVAERDLILERLWPQKLHRLQVRVELVDDCQWHLQHVLDDESHCDVVGEADLVAHTDELSFPGNRHHFLGQRATQTESCASGGEPEGDLLVRLLHVAG